MKRHSTTARRGVAAVEFAVILPVLLLLVLGTVEATSMIYLKQSIQIAAYEGARVALVPGSNKNNVIGACNQILKDRNVQGATVTVTPAAIKNQPYGTFIQVKVRAPCKLNGFFPPWFYVGKSLVAQVEMMKETD
ncbi:MAG: TadE family protein [Planctomycetota bacterium]